MEIFIGISTTLILLMAAYTIVSAVVHIVESYREKKERAKFKYCKGCGSRLSEWFSTGSGYMRCFSCGTVSGHKWHQPALHGPVE